MLIGYARTSTREQIAGFEAQLAELKAAGCKKVFQEQVSAVSVGKREELESALDYVREGDTLVVTKIDRLARSLPHLLQIIERLEKKGVALRILSMQIDTSTPNGKLMLSIMGAIAEFERALMLERQLDGIAAAKQAGKYKGRQPTAKRKADKVLELAAQNMTRQEIAEKTGIGIASVYRILSAAKPQAGQADVGL
ncbi:DNA invertase Pin-like site-specific DNA recombinase [Nitrosospira multiformis]|uniref:DNA invertase Pin-like site-specific DNA recombinase n=1 Tax=Nitrosospira multiformis TaxID=1231 RepID=A0A2T5I7L2_9PROT|nr:recombinase family protein [Nitrosospira multiformis]PTQ79799.1 DNA invertase Pin-like site-specific DNA recombinase [Nitrosospira multiformis]